MLGLDVVTVALNFVFFFNKLSGKLFDGEMLRTRELNNRVQKVAWIHL